MSASRAAAGLTARNPARNPASNFWMRGRFIPPTKPIFPVRVSSPASAPARKLPSCSLNTSARTFGNVTGLPESSSTGLSMSRNFALGFSRATLRVAVSIMNPTATTSSAP